MAALTYVTGDHVISGAYTGRGDGLVTNSVPRAAIATDSAGAVLINGGGGSMSSEQYLSKARGGLGQSIVSLGGTSGAMIRAFASPSAGGDTVGVWSTTLVGTGDLSTSLVVPAGNLFTQSASYVAIYNSSSQLSSEQYLAKSRGGLAADVTSWTGIVRAQTTGVWTTAQISNSDILASAGIDRSKLATSSNTGWVIYNSTATTPGTAMGQLSEEQYLSKARGGLGQSVVSLGGTSGAIIRAFASPSAGGDTVGVWSTTLVGTGDLSTSLVIPTGNLFTQSASYVAIYNSSSQLSSEQFLTKSRGGLATDVTSWAGIVRAQSTGVWTTTLVSNSDIVSLAAIDRSKFSVGTPAYVVYNAGSSAGTGSGLMVEEQYLSKVRGGLATDVSSWTGIVRAQTTGVWTTGQISNSDVLASAGIDRSKLATSSNTGWVIYNSTATTPGTAMGQLSEEQYLSKARGGLGQSVVSLGGTSGAMIRAFASPSAGGDTVGVWSTTLVGTGDLSTSLVIPTGNLFTQPASYVAIYNSSSQLSSEQFLSFQRGGLNQSIVTTSSESRIAGILAGGTATNSMSATTWAAAMSNAAGSVVLRDTNSFIYADAYVLNLPATTALSVPSSTSSVVYDAQSVIRSTNSSTTTSLLTINFPTSSATTVCWCGSIDVCVNVSAATPTVAPTGTTPVSTTGFFHLLQRFNRFISSAGAGIVSTSTPAVKLIDMDTSLGCDIYLGSANTNSVTLYCKPSTTNWLSWQAAARVYQRMVIAATNTADA